MSQTSKLWQLQLLEKFQKSIAGKQPGDQLTQRLKQLKKDIETCQATLKKLKSSYQQIKEQGTALEQRNNELRLKSDQLSAKIYDGSLHIKELEGSQQRVARLKQDIQKLEDMELEKMQLKEDLKQEWQREKSALDVLTVKYKELHGQYLKEKEEIKKQAVETARKIEALIGSLDKDLYQQYQQLKIKYPDPVGRVTKDACSGCHLGISFDKIKELKYEKDLVNCNHCGRLLFWDPVIPE
ncbi:C4-type zinc ribbon domain-containing protein [Desulfotomaculum defluvii]